MDSGQAGRAGTSHQLGMWAGRAGVPAVKAVRAGTPHQPSGSPAARIAAGRHVRAH